ncbi:MAG: transposase zinc-binding domain-containing protein [Planctomycetota bacterium]
MDSGKGGTGHARQRREPEGSVLYRVLREHLTTFFADADEGLGSGLPRFVQREVRRYLDCGILACGFARVHCSNCNKDELVAFSCKGRGFCPSYRAMGREKTSANAREPRPHGLPVRQSHDGAAQGGRRLIRKPPTVVGCPQSHPFGIPILSRILTGPDASADARDVPVMRLRVADAEETAYASLLRELPPATPEEFLALVSEEAQIDLTVALGTAVRIPPRERERTLDLIAPQIEILSEDAIRALVPSLRWIAVTSEPGGGPPAWRGWFLERERKKAGERPKLLLLRTAPRRAAP